MFHSLSLFTARILIVNSLEAISTGNLKATKMTTKQVKVYKNVTRLRRRIFLLNPNFLFVFFQIRPVVPEMPLRTFIQTMLLYNISIENNSNIWMAYHTNHACGDGALKNRKIMWFTVRRNVITDVILAWSQSWLVLSLWLEITTGICLSFPYIFY